MARKHFVVTHHRPQVSDLCLMWLLKNFGKKDDYQAIEHGLGVRYVGDGGRGLQEAEHPKITYSGVGRGKYDEHGKAVLECEASLIGRDLGLLRDLEPEDKSLSEDEKKRHTFQVADRTDAKTFFVNDANLRDIFAAVVRDDINGSPPFSFGNLVSTVYGLYPEGMRKVMNFTFSLLDAAYAHGSIPKEERSVVHQDTASFLLATVARMEKRKHYHERASRRVREWLEKRRTHDEFEPLNLIDAVAILMRAGVNYRKWMLTALRAELAEQHHFHTVTADAASKANLRDVTLRFREIGGGKERVERRVIASVETDDPHVSNYLFSAEYGCDAAIVIRKNSRGQVQIFPGGYRKEAKKGKYARISFKFLMVAVAAFVRITECRQRQLQPPGWEVLVSDHGPKDETSWFFYSKPGWLLNGSLTAVDVPPTALSLQEIEEVVIWAIDDSYDGKRRMVIASFK